MDSNQEFQNRPETIGMKLAGWCHEIENAASGPDMVQTFREAYQGLDFEQSPINLWFSVAKYLARDTSGQNDSAVVAAMKNAIESRSKADIEREKASALDGFKKIAQEVNHIGSNPQIKSSAV